MRRLPFNTVAFDSLADLQACTRPDLTYLPGDGGSWFGHVSGEQAIAMLATGDTACVPEAEKLLGQFDIHLATAGTSLDLSPAGFMPCVPAFIGGEPECMYDLVSCESDTSPLNIIVNPTSSAGIDAATLRKRGTVILAAVMALAALRPVQLEVACMMSSAKPFDIPRREPGERRRQARVSTMRVTINSAPLDLASAGYALSHPGFTRHLLYGFGTHEFGANGDWPSVDGQALSNTRSEKTEALTFELLGEDPAQTLLIPAIHLHDPIVEDPKRWLSEVLAKYGQTELA